MRLDTSGLLCVHNQGQPFRAQAVPYFRQGVRKVTHNYVLAELIALSHIRRLPREPVLQFVTDLTQAKSVETVWVDEELHNRAMSLLHRRLDKTYSLCDAVSFVLMLDRGLTDALTTDQHFEQEGFRRLLKT